MHTRHAPVIIWSSQKRRTECAVVAALHTTKRIIGETWEDLRLAEVVKTTNCGGVTGFSIGHSREKDGACSADGLVRNTAALEGLRSPACVNVRLRQTRKEG